jgi:hypothetical protein
MKSNSRKEDLKEDEIVDTLLRLNSKNLESRIKRLEEEIQNRERLRDELLGIIGTQQLGLEDKIWRLRYASPNTNSGERLKDHEIELRKLEQMKIREEIASREDISGIQEKLERAWEELQEEIIKLKLVGSVQQAEERNRDEYGKGQNSINRHKENSTH